MDATPNPNRAPAPGRWMKFLMKVTAVDAGTLQQCPPQDWDNVRAIGEIMVCTWLYQACLFVLIGHLLFASPNQLRPDVVVASIFIATFILVIDSYMVMRSGWHLSGIHELKRGGIDISGGPLVRIKAGCFLAIRIVVLSIGLAQLTALFVALLIFRADITSRLEADYLKANEHLLVPAATLADDGIRRATDAVTAQTARVNALAGQVNTLRQNEIDPFASDPRAQEIQGEVARLIDQQSKAAEAVQAAEAFAINESGGIKGGPNNSGQPGYGPRYRAAMEQAKIAKARADELAKSLADARARLDALRVAAAGEQRQQSRDQLPVFEEKLKAENAKLAGLKSELATLIEGREHAIRQAVENAPDHVNRQTGFLAQIVALEHMSEEDRKIAFVILLIDFVSFGFELAAVLAKITSYVPTTYSALLARDAYMTAVRVADAMMAELNPIESKETLAPGISAQAAPVAPAEPASPPVVPLRDPPVQPVKRGRGRPRKNPVTVTGVNGQGTSAQSPAPPTSA